MLKQRLTLMQSMAAGEGDVAADPAAVDLVAAVPRPRMRTKPMQVQMVSVRR